MTNFLTNSFLWFATSHKTVEIWLDSDPLSGPDVKAASANPSANLSANILSNF